MAPRRGVGIDTLDVQIAAEAGMEHVYKLRRQLGRVGVPYNEAVLLDVQPRFFYILNQLFHHLGAALDRSEAFHLAFAAHMDDGAQADETAHGGRKPAHPPAATEEFQVVRKEILGVMVHFAAAPFDSLFSAHARIQAVAQLEGVEITEQDVKNWIRDQVDASDDESTTVESFLESYSLEEIYAQIACERAREILLEKVTFDATGLPTD